MMNVSDGSLARERFEDERRRSRLYGSNSRRITSGAVRKKKKISCASTETACTSFEDSPSPQSIKKVSQQTDCRVKSRQDELAKPRPWAQGEKIIDPAKSACVQPRAWHLGYVNAPTASGNPSAQAARYGPDGAFNLHIQCADRVSRQAGKLEAILRSDDISHVEQYNSVSNVWHEPLRLGGKGHLYSTPKMWGNKSSGAKMDHRLPRRLKKSLDNDIGLWKEMAARVKKERRRGMGESSKAPKATTVRRCTCITQGNQRGRTSSNQSQRVFCLR